MGKYIDLFKNWNMTTYNASYTPKNDTITDAFTIAKEKTNDRVGQGILFFIFFVIYIHLVTKENQFNISNIQALLSTSGLTLAFALAFLYLGIMNSSQFFVWLVLAVFVFMSWNTINTT